MKYKKGHFYIENISAEKIAKKFGTPAYVYSYDRIKNNINNFKKNFKKVNPLICFSVKSNYNIKILEQISKKDDTILNEADCRWLAVVETQPDLASAVELQRVLVTRSMELGSDTSLIRTGITAIPEDIFERLLPEKVVASRVSEGGTGFDRVREQLEKWKSQLISPNQ